MRYPALIDGQKGAYGVVFPDLDVGAMGDTIEEAILNAEDVLRSYVSEMEKNGWPVAPPSPLEAIETPPGNQLVSIPLIRLSNKVVRANMALDEGVVRFIDDEAKRYDMTRKAYVTWMVHRIAQMGG